MRAATGAPACRHCRRSACLGLRARPPISRGWREFTFDDEPYWNIYFGNKGSDTRVTPLASSMLPPEDPQKETVAWAVTREDGGRGVGIVLPHYFRSWRIDDLRTLVLNAVGWTAKLEIPAEGIRSPVPDLAAFHPAAACLNSLAECVNGIKCMVSKKYRNRTVVIYGKF